MVTGCAFLHEYLPSDASPEGVVRYHMRNCSTCREQAFVVDAA